MPTSLANELDLHAHDLITAAEEAGLETARPRSGPGRRARESAELLSVIGSALAGPPKPAELKRLVRVGALAACTADELDRIFSLWRGVLTQQLARNESEVERLERAVDRVAERAAAARDRWEAERIDLIVLGASAGGIGPLNTILREIGDELPATVLVVLHVGEETPSVLSQVLGRGARIPVQMAEEGAKLLLGRVLVAPPAFHLLVEKGRVHLAATPREHYARPSVDALFRSAAAEWGAHLAAVILSGSGSDGVAGIRAVAEAGGVVLAQRPATADFTSMPESAIATGLVRRSADPRALGRLLVRLSTLGRAAVRA